MSEKKPGAPLDPSVVRELAAILQDTGLSEIEYEQGELKLRLSRGVLAAASPVAAAPLAAAPAPAPTAPAPVQASDFRQHPGAVTSPMVGTIYLSPDPESAPFVKEGDSVSEGQTLMIVEAMKTFNPIPAPRAGVVKRVLVADRQPVEFGEALALVE
ncbi:MAG: acetyl-CoA carboxylase biotin carboxyl carrier protein [Alphaproteobacteria bacterium]|nr:acetyl-CoA carboxylase biotin carboxyl carrier protein [Alphaproteobacteria bacterium]